MHGREREKACLGKGTVAHTVRVRVRFVDLNSNSHIFVWDDSAFWYCADSHRKLAAVLLQDVGPASLVEHFRTKVLGVVFLGLGNPFFRHNCSNQPTLI